jgi:hypothetical protein
VGHGGFWEAFIRRWIDTGSDFRFHFLAFDPSIEKGQLRIGTECHLHLLPLELIDKLPEARAVGLNPKLKTTAVR